MHRIFICITLLIVTACSHQDISDFSKNLAPALQAVAAWFALITIPFLWFQMRRTTKWNKMQAQQAILSEHNRFNETDLVKKGLAAGVVMRSRRDPLSDQEVEKLWGNEDAYYAMIDFLNDCEAVALAVVRKAVDEEMAYESHSERIKKATTVYMPFITRLQSHYEDESLLDKLLEVSNRWRKPPPKRFLIRLLNGFKRE